MKLLITADRIRAVIAGARTEKEVEFSLRSHKIKYQYDTSAGYTAIKIPARSGAVLVYRTCSRSAPFQVRSAAPATVYPVIPRLYPDY